MTSSIDDRLKLHKKDIPNKLAVVDLEYQITLSFKQLDIAIDDCVSWLHSLGIRRRSILSLVADNTFTTLIIYLACLRNGIIINPYPSTIEPVDLKRYLEQFQIECLIYPTSSKFCNLFERSVSAITYNPSTFLSDIQLFRSDIPTVAPDTGSPACLYYSSGTTGSPKGILISHRNMVANTSALVDGFRFSSDEKHLVILPMGHTASINYSILPCLWVGGTITIGHSFWKIRQQFWNIVSAHKVTYVQLVPTVLFALIHMPKPSNCDLNLKWIGCGSAPLPNSMQKRFQQRFDLPVGNLYGLSESGPSHIDYPLEADWEPGSIGVPLSCNECAIFDADGNTLPDGEVGDIALRGENIFIGYYLNPEAYAKAVRNRWFFTGDIGFKANNGKYYFSDREKDLIIQGGINIFPGEVEEVIGQIEKVQEVAVIGRPDPILGETVVAYIVPAGDKLLTYEEVERHCLAQLSQHKVPKEVRFVDTLPKGPSGKTLKRILREQFENKSH